MYYIRFGFFSSLCMAWMLSIKYLVFFAEIIKNFSKLTNTSPKWRHLWIFILRQINAPKVCITSVCVFFSSLCMAWMLSIKYFVFFTQILRFSLNWRTNLQNGVIFGILFYVRSITLRFVLHPFVFLSVLWLWLECYRSNTLSFLIKFIRISINWSDTSPKCRLLWNFILLSQCLLGLYYIRLYFYKFLCMAWMLSIKYFIFLLKF